MIARVSKVLVCVVLLLAIAVPATAGKPDRFHVQVEGGHIIYCDLDSDADFEWDYIVDGHFWEEYQSFYFYDKDGNVIRIKNNFLWHGELTDRETGQVFTDKWAESDQYDPADWPLLTQTSTGNWEHVRARGSGGEVRYHAAGRLVILWEMPDPNDPSTWTFLGILDQSGRWPELPFDDVCGLFRAGHVVWMDELPVVIKELQ